MLLPHSGRKLYDLLGQPTKDFELVVDVATAPYEFTRGSASLVAKSGPSCEALVPTSKLTG